MIKIERETADKVLDEIADTMADIEMPIMKKLSLFAEIQKIIYKNTNFSEEIRKFYNAYNEMEKREEKDGE